MTGYWKTSWTMLAWCVAMLWNNAGAAGSEPSELNPASATNGAPASADWSFPKHLTDWKLPETFQIHGFASQGYLHTTGNDFFGRSTNMGSLDFTETGINGSWRPLPNLQASMQVVYRRAGLTDNLGVRVDFGFLDYSFLSDAENLAGVRLGRVFNPFGLYNDTRDMPFTRPSILLPQSIYLDVNRNLALSGDGIQLYGERRTKIGDFSLQINGEYPRTSDPTFKNFFVNAMGPGGLNGEPSWVGRLMYEWEGGKVRLAVTSADANVRFKPSSADLPASSLSFSPVLFSAQYNAEKWTLTSEYALRKTRVTDFGPLSTTNSLIGESYYLQGTYRLSSDWEVFARYDVFYQDRSDRSGEKQAEMTGQPAYTFYSKDLTAGFRWDVTSSIMLRGEYHYIQGTGWVSSLENRGNTAKYWDMFIMSLSFRF